MTAYGSRNALADKPQKLTPAQARTLAIALTKGKVYLSGADRGTSVDPRYEVRRDIADQLEKHDLIEWTSYAQRKVNEGGRYKYGHYTLTAKGRERALLMSDKESSASRQHWIETGRYLKYGDRPEIEAAPKIYAKLVEVGDFVSGTVVATRPGEVDVKVDAGLYAPGTVVTIRVKTPKED